MAHRCEEFLPVFRRKYTGWAHNVLNNKIYYNLLKTVTQVPAAYNDRSVGECFYHFNPWMPPSNVLFQPDLGNKVNRFNNPDNLGGWRNKAMVKKNEKDQHGGGGGDVMHGCIDVYRDTSVDKRALTYLFVATRLGFQTRLLKKQTSG